MSSWTIPFIPAAACGSKYSGYSETSSSRVENEGIRDRRVETENKKGSLWEATAAGSGRSGRDPQRLLPAAIRSGTGGFFPALALDEIAAEDLSGGGLRDFFHELDAADLLVGSHLVGDERHDVLFGEVAGGGDADDECFRDLAGLL